MAGTGFVEVNETTTRYAYVARMRPGGRASGRPEPRRSAMSLAWVLGGAVAVLWQTGKTHKYHRQRVPENQLRQRL